MITGSLKILVDALLVWFLESICVNLFFGCSVFSSPKHRANPADNDT